MSEQTIEGNRLITFFDGGEHADIDMVFEIVPAIWYKDSYWPLDKLPAFDKDWNLLMPIVEKIEELDFEEIEVNICIDQCCVSCDAIEMHFWAQDETKIKSVWHTVVEFIKWYNQNTRTVN